MTTPFTPEQNEILANYSKEMNDSFNDYVDSLRKSCVSSIDSGLRQIEDGARRMMQRGDELNQSYEVYVNTVITEVRTAEAAARDRHKESLKEMRIASVAAIYASGRGLDTAFEIVNQIENKINNPE